MAQITSRSRPRSGGPRLRAGATSQLRGRARRPRDQAGAILHFFGLSEPIDHAIQSLLLCTVSVVSWLKPACRQKGGSGRLGAGSESDLRKIQDVIWKLCLSACMNLAAAARPGRPTSSETDAGIAAIGSGRRVGRGRLWSRKLETRPRAPVIYRCRGHAPQRESAV